MITAKRSGYYRKNLTGKLSYESFCPADLPPVPPIYMDDEMISMLIEAHKNIILLDQKAKLLPDMDVFISMYVEKEALLSSQIEGTQATLEDLFDPTIDRNLNLEVADVVQYTKAMNYALDRLKTLPLCNRLLLETHKILLNSVRGKEKNPGEFRRSQNWIGGHGSTLKDARYIPPSLGDMQQALSSLEKYIHETDGLDVLIKTALIHYQFESIHPFLDGNGRIGRLLIVLYLREQKVIDTPAMYLSYFLKKNRIEYYDRMSEVRTSGNYEQWIKFFLRAIVVSCEDALSVTKKLVKLREKNRIKILHSDYSARARETSRIVLRYLEAHPMIEIGKTAEDLKLSYNTVASALERLQAMKIVKLHKEQERNRVYLYKEYINILKSGVE